MCDKMSRSGRGVVNSVTRLGDFWKFLVTNFITRVAKMFGDLLGYFERFLSKSAVKTFWAIFGKNWAPFNSNIWSHWTVSIERKSLVEQFEGARQHDLKRITTYHKLGVKLALNDINITKWRISSTEWPKISQNEL